MAGFEFVDYLLAGFGLIGGLHNLGLFGKSIGVLRMLFVFTSMGVVFYSLAELGLKHFTGQLTSAERRVYLLYTITNSPTVLASFA